MAASSSRWTRREMLLRRKRSALDFAQGFPNNASQSGLCSGLDTANRRTSLGAPMTPLALLTYPNIDPVAIEFGSYSIKWYGLAYMSGLLIGWLYVRRLISTPELWRGGKPPMTLERVDDLLLFMTAAIIVGGRLGQVLLYDPEFYFANPAEIFKVWKGGMSFHGAFVASALLLWLFARVYKVSAFSVMDLSCAASPIGIFFGRIANFVNSEHWGRTTDAYVGMVFPNGGDQPRHPSQLYEALLEGLVMFIILRFATHRLFALKRPGLVTGLWLLWYGIARSIGEFFREPEPGHILNIGPFTAGQVYCVPMLVLGVYMIWRANRTDTPGKAAV
jgi:phosphatidylglycerol---prolipoprotein diacylglyceryl transferase